ncbi:MAG: phosphotransferase [Dermatophilaceae bacterium]
MSRTPAYLAALASTAVPGLDPVAVQAVLPRPGARFDVGFVIDSQQRRWTVRAPLAAADGARQDATVSLLGLLARRLPFQVPAPKGFPRMPHGRAMVYPYLTGRPLDLAKLPPGPGLAAEIGRAIAALHNVDRGVFDEAGVPAYDADTYRSRHLADLDRAASTGHVPAALLQRWERALEDVTLWRFAPVPTHGRVDGRALLAVFDSDGDARSGHVRAMTGWEDAKVADPADDLAAVVGEASAPAVESVLEAYANARIERPDPHLQRRAILVSELHLLADLLAAATAGDGALVRELSAVLRRLDESTEGDGRLAPPAPPSASESPVLSLVTLDGEAIEPPSGGDSAHAGAEGGPTQEIPQHQLAKVRGLLEDSADEAAADPSDGDTDRTVEEPQSAAPEEPGAHG